MTASKNGHDLSTERLKEVLRYDSETGVFTWSVGRGNRSAGSAAGHSGSDGYSRIKIGSRLYLAHRVAWLYVYGEWPHDQIDHINRITSDNRIKNLREVTNKQNMENTAKISSNSSGYKGVTFHKNRGKWMAQIQSNGDNIYLGVFNTPQEAAKAYSIGAAKYHTHNPATKS